MNTRLSRLSVLKTLAGSAALAGAAQWTSTALDAEAGASRLKGNIRHSVSRWCYGKTTLDALCAACKEIGIESVELLGPDDWPVVKKHGLVCAMCNGPDSIGYGWNRVEHHEKLLAGFERMIPQNRDGR